MPRVDWDSSTVGLDHQILAQCVQEGLQEIHDIVLRARAAVTTTNELNGYCSPDRVLEQIRALFNHMQHNEEPKAGGNWAYVSEPWDSRRPSQRIRLVREVLHFGEGTCIDWTLVFASLLANIGLVPWIVIVERVPDEEELPRQRHALVGCPFEEKQLSSSVLPGAQLLQELNEAGPMVVIDPSWIPTFRDGIEVAECTFEKMLSDPEKTGSWLPSSLSGLVRENVVANGSSGDQPMIVLAVDVSAARDKGIAPVLPVSGRLAHSRSLPTHFQKRRELQSICTWRQEGLRRSEEMIPGAMSLYGFSGMGKTTLLLAFLSLLDSSGVSRLANLEDWPGVYAPDALFFWDFNADASPTACAGALHEYLANLPRGDAGGRYTFRQVRFELSRTSQWEGCSILVVLDGVESVQHRDGSIVEDGAGLADFLRWCCMDAQPIRVLLASRQRIAELRPFLANGRARELRIGRLPDQAACQLLRDFGVIGSGDDLDAVIKQCGGNAQALQRVARALTEWYDGDPKKAPSVDPSRPLESALESFYVPKLAESAPALLLLKTMALVDHMAISTDLLAGAYFFTSIARHDLDSAAVLGALNHCDSFSLLTRSTEGTGLRFDHPGVEECFRHWVSPREERMLRKAIADYLEVQTRSRPAPSSREELPPLAELAHQLTRLGRVRDANEVYRTRMSAPNAEGQDEGPFDLLSSLNTLTLGRQLTETILRRPGHWTPCQQRLRPLERARLLNDKGGFERELGLLNESEVSYRQAFAATEGLIPLLWTALRDAKAELRLNRSFALRNPPRTFIFRGYLEKALSASEEAGRHEERANDSEGQQIACCLQAHAQACMGRFQSAIALWKRARDMESRNPGRIATEDLRRRIFTKAYSIHWAHTLMRSGRTSDANSLIQETRHEMINARKSEYVVLQCDLLGEHLKLHREQPTKWRENLETIRTDAKSGGRMDLMVWSDLSLARFALVAMKLAPTNAKRKHLVATCRDAIERGIELSEVYGYALHWIDLQVARGCLDLKEANDSADPGKASECVCSAHGAARLALYGQPLVDESDPGKDSKTILAEELSMIGAANVACGYEWGMVNALRLLVNAHRHPSASDTLVVPEGKNLQDFAELELKLRSRLQPNPQSVPETLR